MGLITRIWTIAFKYSYFIVQFSLATLTKNALQFIVICYGFLDDQIWRTPDCLLALEKCDGFDSFPKLEESVAIEIDAEDAEDADDAEDAEDAEDADDADDAEDAVCDVCRLLRLFPVKVETNLFEDVKGLRYDMMV